MKLDNVIAVRKTKVVYRDGDLAVKVFDENYSKADVLNEALNQARIEQTDLHIPEIVEVTKIDGKWAIITRFIEGKTLEALMNEEPEKYDKYLEFFVDLHLEVHRQQSPLLNKLKDKMHRQISITDLDATTRYDLHTRLESMPNHKKVCHGDFNPSNIPMNAACCFAGWMSSIMNNQKGIFRSVPGAVYGTGQRSAWSRSRPAGHPRPTRPNSCEPPLSEAYSLVNVMRAT